MAGRCLACGADYDTWAEMGRHGRECGAGFDLRTGAVDGTRIIHNSGLPSSGANTRRGKPLTVKTGGRL